MGKYFGTDGFRGEANVGLTVDHAFRIGRYLGWYYGKKNGKKARIVQRESQKPSQPALRQLAHRLEQGGGRQAGLRPGIGVPQRQAGETAPGVLQSLHHSGGQQGEVFPLRCLGHQDGLRPEVRPPVDQRHMAAEVRQIQSVLQGGVAATRHRHILPRVEGPVANGAERNPRQGVLTRQAQGPPAHAGGQDHRSGGIGAVVGDHLPGDAVPDLQHFLQLQPGAQ